MIKQVVKVQNATEYGQASKRACSSFARCVPCHKCLYFGTCSNFDFPLPRMGRYVVHIAALCEQAQNILPSNENWAGKVTPVKAILEDPASVLIKIRVAIPHKHKRAMIVLTGRESDYVILRQIYKAWRELILQEDNDL